MIHTYDPVVVFWGGGYRYLFEEDFLDAQIRLGQQISYQLGVGFAVNERVTLSTSLLGLYVTETELNGVGIPGSMHDPIRMRFSLTSWRNCRIVEPFAEIGMTDTAPRSCGSCLDSLIPLDRSGRVSETDHFDRTRKMNQQTAQSRCLKKVSRSFMTNTPRLLFALWTCWTGLSSSATAGDAPVRDSQFQIQRRVRSWRAIRDNAVVKQQRDYSCGAAAVATLLRYYWNEPISERSVLDSVESVLTPEELQDRAQNGLTMTDLRKASVKLGYTASIGKLELAKLLEAKVPVVVAVKVRGIDHFVVFRGVVANCAYLADPSRGNVRVPLSVFASQWIENTLLVVAPKGKTKSEFSQLAIRPSETQLGWLNYQVIRTQAEKVFSGGLQ